MNEFDDGGPAFPIPSDEHLGMTLRDHFAAKAMNGMLSNSESDGTHEPTLRALFRDRTLIRDYAELAYDIADAMLKARNP